MTEQLQAAPSFPSGDYEIDSVLGSGGMAVVYRARDLRRQRSVAIKVLRAELTHVTGSDRFRREIAVAASFAHPHIVPLLDLGEAVDALGRAVPFYVMPLIEGETLRDRIHRAPRLTLPEVLRMTREILGALHYAHQQGVIHRDIKPANVLLTGGHALVADFGVARALPGATGLHENDSTITHSGLTVGTPAYMSPEQALGDKFIDERTDLYSLACVLYEMLAGQPPFSADSSSSIISLKLKGKLVPLTSLRPDLPPSLDQVLARALAPEPSQRFPTAASFVDALSAFDSGAHALTLSGDVGASRGSSGSWTIPTWAQRVPATGESTVPMGVRGASLLAIAATVCAIAIGAMTLRSRDAAVPAPSADRARVAVLPFELLDADSSLSLLATGLTVDLIDELAQYPAITVISRNGVSPYVGGLISTDSIARALDVGSVVTGDVRRIGDSVAVTVRLIDGASNAQLARASATGPNRDVLGVRTTLLDSVTTFLRRVIGQQLGDRERQVTSNPEAWALLAQARGMSEGELVRANALSARDRAARFLLADSLLMRAASLDARWSAPYVLSSRVLLQRANFEEGAALGGGAVDPGATPVALRRSAVERAELALARDPTDDQARHLRGRARLELWRTARPVAPDSLRAAAEADLRTVTARRRDLAEAWSDLSLLLQMTGNYDGSRDAAEAALTADAFLRSAEAIVGRLFFTSLASGRVDEARRWCERGQQRYPRDPRFWGCELTMVGWTGSTSTEVETAWRLLRESEARDSANLLVSGWGTRRLLVAAVAARAGLADSARAIVASVRTNAPATVPADQLDYGEAHVCALLGDTAGALPLLARYLRANPALRGQVRYSPWFAALRSDAQFIELTLPR
jgi:eukaryotic-like serine/threonine-protein kinase